MSFYYILCLIGWMGKLRLGRVKSPSTAEWRKRFTVFPLCLQEGHSPPHTISFCNRQESRHASQVDRQAKFFSAVNLLRLIY